MPRKCLDFQIAGRSAYTCNQRHWGGPRAEGLIWYITPTANTNDQYLDHDGTWKTSDRFEPMPGFATEEEAIAFAEQFRDDRPKGIKLPFQLAGQDVWINGNRLDFPSIGVCSSPFCICNGPEGQATAFYRAGDGMWASIPPNSAGSWVSYLTAQAATNTACEQAGVDRIDLATLAPVTGPIKPPPLEAMLGKTLAALVSLPAPPPDVRGLIRAKTHLWAPEDVTDIPKWLQENWRPKAGAKPAPTPGVTANYEINAGYDEREYGRADFSRNARYSGTVRFTNEELRDLFDGIEDVDEMRQKLEEAVQEDPDGFDCAETTDEEYSDHEVNDTGDREWDISANRLRQVIDDFIANNPDMDPDREEELEDDLEPDIFDEEEEFEDEEEVEEVE